MQPCLLGQREEGGWAALGMGPRVPLFLAVLVLAVPVLAGGCSLVNDPDRSILRVADAGMDAPPDVPRDGDGGDGDGGDGGDGGDAGDTCAPGDRCGTDVERDCSNNRDDDEDGLVDCNDFDCSDEPECCGLGEGETGDPIIEASALGSGFLRWVPVPTSEPAEYPRPAQTGGGVEGFTASIPRAILWDRCVPLAVGLRVDVELEARGPSTCSEGDCYAKLVLSGADDMESGRGLLDDLAVVMDAEGVLRVTQNGQTIGETANRGRFSTPVTIDLTSGVDVRGDPAIFAEVRYFDSSSGMERALLPRQRVFPQSQLLRRMPGSHIFDTDCVAAPGLVLGVEALGTSVYVRSVEAARASCPNPSQFEGPGDSITVEETSFGCWAGWGFSSPALGASHDTSAEGDARWQLLVEGTNVDREIDDFAFVGFAAGHGISLGWDSITSSTGWMTNESTAVGFDPPACNDAGTCDQPGDPVTYECDVVRSVRDPYLHYLLDEGDLAAAPERIVGYAQELDGPVSAMDRNVFGLYLGDRFPTTLAGSVTATLRLSPDQLDECSNLRDPAVIPLTNDQGDSGLWLLFTCIRQGAPHEIRAVRLDESFSPVEPVESQLVLDPAELGDYASAGVEGPEPVVVFSPDGTKMAIRLWFVATARGDREKTVALAQAEVRPDTGTVNIADELPPFEPYPANPVMRSGRELLEGGALSRIAVTRDPSRPQTLRFLVARRIGSTYDLLPFEQTWGPFQ